MSRRPTSEDRRVRHELQATRARLRELVDGDEFQSGRRAAWRELLDELRLAQQRHLETEARGIRMTPSMALGLLIQRMQQRLGKGGS
jgi:hypothetical protein